MQAPDRDLVRVGPAVLFSVIVFGTACDGGGAGMPTLPAPTTRTAPSAETTKPAATAPDPEEDSATMPTNGESAKTAPKAPVSEPVDPAQLGRITGFATFSGEAPKRMPITAIGNTTGCSEHAETPLTETVIVNAGKLQNAFVYISRGLSDWVPTPVADEPVMLDQLGCVYRPHVVGVRAGQTLLARNSDGISHNVHVIATKNDDPNKTQGAGAKPLEIELDKEEVPVTFVCDIHPWMKAYACVVDHPFFAVTAADGSFSIEGVPPGDYTLTAWHEKLRKVRQSVTVGAGGVVSVDFAFEPK